MKNTVTVRKRSHFVYGYIILIAIMVFQFTATAQNIDATIGTPGQFTVKTQMDTFMTVSQSTRNLYIYHGLALPSAAGNSTNGVIYKGVDRFIHTYETASTYGQNTFIGLNSGNFSLTGGSMAYASFNTAVGPFTLTSLTTGYYNSSFGWSALNANTSGSNNCAFGMSALLKNINGNSNCAFGRSALESNTSGTSNSAFGTHSLVVNTIGDQNSAFGYSSLKSNTEGEMNSAFGYNALASHTTTDQNSAFGYYALVQDSIGEDNSAFGAFALNRNVSGIKNTAFGSSAFYSSTGNNNTALGYYAGATLTTGSNVTCIGYYSLPSAVDVSNEITLGDTHVTTLRCHTTTITALSDARDKRNIRDLNLGIDFLMRVKPRLYNWDRRDWYKNKISDGSKMEKTPTAGFIAQELDEAQTFEQAEWLKLVLKNNPDRFEATPGNLLPIMVKAIQEIKTEKDREITGLKNENIELKTKLLQFEQVQKILVSKIEKLESTSSQVKEVNMTTGK